MAQVTEVRNPEALRAEPLRKMMEKAYPPGGVVAPDGFEACEDEFRQMVLSPNFHILVGVEDGLFKAVTVLLMPDDKFCPTPQVLNFYNKGSAKLRDALFEKLLDILAQEGYTSFWALNGTGKADEAWARMFKKYVTMRPLGSVLQFEVK